MKRNSLLAGIYILFLVTIANAQFRGLTFPPNGDNQRAIVTQYIGLVSVSIDYSSPDVHAPDGSDRRGKIWGTLVPYGLTNLGFGTCNECPWRGGANEGTIFKISHDVKVQGQPLKAGTYGLHFIVEQNEWTVIFSNNSTAWGSFTYDPKEDALRVKAKPEKSEYREWLTYEFTDRQPKKATVAMKWEDLQLPFTISVDNIEDLYVEAMDRDLQDSPGFTFENWVAAARYTLQTKKHLDKGLYWAQTAVSSSSYGTENFRTLSTLAELQDANGQAAESKKTLERALNHRTAGPVDIHQYARFLMLQKKNEEAYRIFELNAKRYPKEWPVEVGLTRMYSAKGQYQEALKHAKLALETAPDEQNRTSLQNMIKTLEQGKDVN